MTENKEIIQHIYLVAADTGEYNAEASLNELRELSEAAGGEVVGETTQKLQSPISATYVGAGKLEEIKEAVKFKEADLVIVDDELSGVQIRNMEDAVGVKVIDRTMLILDIFAQRAVSGEGKLQVELAQQKYLLPRLIGFGTNLSRQQGGIGSRGSGESKLEYDRRHIRRRIDALQGELDELAQRRQRTRDRRRKNDIPTITIVGYTNVGKSTLLNYLTDAGVLEKDMLFATLDPTARKIVLPDGQEAMLIDTVGLIRRLPHQLVQAFHSTLEEAANADLILHLCDISDPASDLQREVTENLLDELSCGDIPRISVYNKIDKLDENAAEITDGVAISAKSGEGIDRLLAEIAKKLSERMSVIKLLVPYADGGAVDLVRRNGKVLSESFTENGTELRASINNKILYAVEKYIVG